MTTVHIIAAILATWRLTEIIVGERITDFIRKRSQHYFWTCAKCVSVWCGLIALVLYRFFPWGNWPFALSMTFLMSQTIVQSINSSIQLKQIQAQHVANSMSRPPVARAS